jgi:hypothetical protein
VKMNLVRGQVGRDLEREKEREGEGKGVRES